MGFRTVALSSSDSKRDLSLKLGAKEYLDGSKVDQAAELTKLGGADVIFATAPNASAINNLVGGLAPGGTILVSAIAQEPLSVPTTSIIPKRAKIQGRCVFKSAYTLSRY
jgi:D-arabinose 1-dehydrogenase-like Zn-dependent alcohol dehydrogenase